MSGPARKWVKWSLAGIAALLCVVLLAATWLVTTEAGLRRAVTFVESVGSVKIRVEGASGRLIGPLVVDTVEIEHPRASIRIAGLEADYEPLEILAGRISAEGVKIREATVALRPATGPPRPPSFMPGWLTVAVDDASVANLLIVSPNGIATPFHHIRGSARIARSRLEFKGVHARSSGWAVAGAGGTLFAREPLALDATAAWSLTEGDLVAGIARATGDLERLLVDAQVAAPARGRVQAEVRDLSSKLTFRGKADIESLDLAQWIEKPPVGALAASLEFDGDPRRYAARGTVHGQGLPANGIDVDARASYASPVVTFESITLTAAPGLDVRAFGTLRAGDEPAFDVSASWDAFRWPLAGDALIASPRGTMQAQGWTEFSYRVDGDFVPAQGPPFAGEASGRFEAAALRVEQSSWRVLGGRVTLAGSLGRGDSPDWTVSGRAAGIDPSQLRPELPGKLGFGYSASGNGFAADGPWTARIRDLDGTFRGQPARGSGGISRTPGRLEFEDLALSLGPARLQADGVIGSDANLDARLVSDDLSAILPELGGEVNATVGLRGESLAIGFIGHDLAYGSHRAVVLSVDARVDREGREHSWLRLRSNGITLAGFAISDTRLSLDGLAQDHALTFRVGAGEDAVSLRGRGGWADDRYTLALENITASGPRTVPWKLSSASRLTASGRDAALEPVCLAYETRRICFGGRWNADGEWSLEADTDAFPLEALDPKRRGAPGYRGLLSAKATASARPGQPWIADLDAQIRDAALTYQSASGQDRAVALGNTRLSLDSDAGRHRLDLRVTDAADLDLAVALAATRLPDAAFADLPVSGTVRGRTRQLNLLPLLVDTIDNASGEADLDFTVAGRIGAPVLAGEARLTDGTLDFYQTNLRLRDLTSTLRLADTSLTLRAAGKAGDGTLEVDGRFGWRDRRLNGELALTGERLLVANVPEAHVLASPDLRFKLDDRRIDVTGEVAIPEARIRPADTAGAVLVSSDERIVRPETGGDDGKPFVVTSDVRLALGDKVFVKAYGLSATITGAVRTRTQPSESTIGSGELEVKEGEYNAYGRELEIERGRLLFTGGPVTDPGVDLRATRELPGYKVGVIARGPLRRPQLTLFSEPSLPQSQIASMLIVGRSSIQGDPGAPDGDVSTTAEGGAFLAGQLGKYVGLDDVGLTQDADTGSELVLGKYLSPRLYVSYGISLVDEINTLKLRYTIGDRWVISAESGQESAGDIEYRIEDYQMKSIIVDQIASVTQACGLSHELRVSSEIPCEEGIVLAVEILTDKSQYNTLELTSGRMAKVSRGNVVVGALGHRKALFGYSGHLPAKLAPGDVIQMLNMGGVLGVCDSVNPDKGRPFDCRVLGTVLHFPYLGERIGVPARVGMRKLDYDAALETNGVPVVALAGTCMEAGKTAAACAMISRMRHRGLVVDAFKATGVSLRRDILAFEDSGARRSMIFTDFGIVTTTPKTGPALTRTMLTEMSAGRPDVIVFELGDGILGAYGVEAILDAPDIRQALTSVVLSANDPVAAWGGVKLLRERFGIEPAAVTGPSTDNSVGVDIIRERLDVPAFNAMTNGAALGDCVIAAAGLDKVAHSGEIGAEE